LANDRAFVSTDSAMQQLIAHGPAAARDCLKSQAGRIAGQSSCVGPWTAWMNARVGYYKSLPGIGQRAKVSLNLSNPLAAVDMMLHGDDARGWGTRAIPDQTLLYVRGFSGNQFKYEVNPRFGATSPRTTAVLNPFRVTLDVQFDLGRDVQRQQVDLTLRPPPGIDAARATVDTIKRRLLLAGLNSPQDVYGYFLYLKDSLALSADQIARLEAARRPFRARVDSMYGALASWLYAMPSNFDGAAAAARLKATNDDAWVYMHDQGKVIQQIVTPAQLQLVSQLMIGTLMRPLSGARWLGLSGAIWY
jgi:hypothetical protein